MTKRNRTLTILLGILLTPLILFVVLAVALYLPPVQQWAVNCAADYASEQTGMDISVERVRLRFPLDLSVQGLKAIQPRKDAPQVKDTLISLNEAIVTVELLPLLHSQVEIDRLRLIDTHLNTVDFVEAARIRGHIDEVSAESHGIDLRQETVLLNNAMIDGAVLDIALNDSVPEDTTETKVNWRIMVQKAKLTNSDITLHMPGDTLQVEAKLQNLTAADADIDLGSKLYKVRNIELNSGEVLYDNNFAIKQQRGIDVNHIALNDINIGIDSLEFQAPALSLNLRNLTAKEKCGLQITDMHSHIKMDSLQLLLPDFSLTTPYSTAKADVCMDLNVADDINPGTILADFDMLIGKPDVEAAVADLPQMIMSQWPDVPMHIDGKVDGNMNHVNINRLSLLLPDVVEARANGSLTNPTDLDRMRGNVEAHLNMMDMGIVRSFMDKETAKTIRLPRMKADAKLGINGQQYDVDLHAYEGNHEMLHTNGTVNLKSQSYDMKAQMYQLAVHDFLPGYGKIILTGNAKATGVGMDRGRITANLSTDADHIDGEFGLDAIIDKNRIKATATTDLRHADFMRLGITKVPLDMTLCAHVDVKTDLNDYYEVFGTLSDVVIRDSAKTYRPADTMLEALTRKDTTYMHAYCGDFEMLMHAHGGYKSLMKISDRLTAEANRQIEERRIDEHELRKLLPTMDLYLKCGHDNPVYNTIRRMEMDYEDVYAKFRCSPTGGLNGEAYAKGLKMEGYQLDEINFNLKTEDDIVKYNGSVVNIQPNDYIFEAQMEGTMTEHGLSTMVNLFDEKHELGLMLGAEAKMVNEGILMHLSPERPILGYRPFSLNQENYILLRNDNRILADVQLRGDDGTGIQIYSTDDNAETWQDLTLSIQDLQLEPLLATIPYAPKMTGALTGDFHITMSDMENFAVSTDMEIQKMTYEKNKIGDLQAELVYMPHNDGSHYVDGILSLNQREVATVQGTYNFETEKIDATISSNHFPLEMVNGFIPNQLFGLGGFADGELELDGTSSKPQVNGELMLEEAFIESVPYGVHLRFDNDPVRIEDSKLLLENFNIYAHDNNPLTVMGSIDFSDLDRMSMNVRMRAKNYQIINAKETRKSIVCGKAFVNFYGSMQGLLNNLSLRGKLDVLGTTDMTYILRDTPITTDNNIEDLVVFTNFSDTTETEVRRPALSGMNMDVTLSISNTAHILAALNSNHSNYIDLMGGGDLRMRYNNADGISLIGRYTLMGGEMKYALPVIPLKTFTIDDGSYVEFKGNMMNPTLNIKATEKTQAMVSGSNGVDRSVDFLCGVEITKTLEDMGLEFTIEAPEDQEITNDLQTMGAAQRGKLAVSMLTTGMYLADGNTSAFSMNNALSSFLSSQIDNITGSALRSVDLSMGLENRTDEFGHQSMDYTFKFSKRLWNNRVKIDIGGRVSSGSDASRQESAFFDNVSLEYRLDDNASKNLKAYYNANSYDWLEGRSQEFGAGFVWRKSYQNFKDIFRKAPATIQMQPNVIRQNGSSAAQQGTVRPDTIKNQK